MKNLLALLLSAFTLQLSTPAQPLPLPISAFSRQAITNTTAADWRTKLAVTNATGGEALLVGTNVWTGTNRYTLPVLATNTGSVFAGDGSGLTGLPYGTNAALLTSAQTFTGAKTFDAAIYLGSGSGLIAGGLADLSLTTAGGSFLSYGSGGTRGSLVVAPDILYIFGGAERLRLSGTSGTFTFGNDANTRPSFTHLGSTNVLRIATYGAAGTVIELAQADAPDVPSGNSARIYAKDDAGTTRLYTMAEDGTEFLISPHAKHSPGKALDGADPDPVVFHERNVFLGRERFIHVTAAVREIERLTGKQFIFDRPVPKQDWSEAQSRLRKAQSSARLEEQAALAEWQARRQGPKPTVRPEFKPRPDPFKP